MCQCMIMLSSDAALSCQLSVYYIVKVYVSFLCLFSQAVVAGTTMYISGCLGIDPKTNNLVSGGVEPEAHQVGLLWFKCDIFLIL